MKTIHIKLDDERHSKLRMEAFEDSETLQNHMLKVIDFWLNVEEDTNPLPAEPAKPKLPNDMIEINLEDEFMGRKRATFNRG